MSVTSMSRYYDVNATSLIWRSLGKNHAAIGRSEKSIKRDEGTWDVAWNNFVQMEFRKISVLLRGNNLFNAINDCRHLMSEMFSSVSVIMHRADWILYSLATARRFTHARATHTQ